MKKRSSISKISSGLWLKILKASSSSFSSKPILISLMRSWQKHTMWSKRMNLSLKKSSGKNNPSSSFLSFHPFSAARPATPLSFTDWIVFDIAGQILNGTPAKTWLRKYFRRKLKREQRMKSLLPNWKIVIVSSTFSIPLKSPKMSMKLMKKQ